MKLKNKTILITGASSGIGEATAIAAARAGATVLCVGRRESELRRVVETIRTETGKEAIAISADITTDAGREKIVRSIPPEGLHILINNAGITAHGRFDATAPSVLRNTMEINFFAMAELTRLLLPILKRTTGERLIALVSTPSGLYGIPGRFAYSASKAAGHALMESLRVELRADRIHTTLFCPGYTKTALRTSGLAADGTQLIEEQAKHAREPDEVASLLLRAIEKKRRIAFTDTNGRALFALRLIPALLDRILAKKLKADF